MKFLLTTIVGAVLAVHSAAATWIVDASGGADFPSIATAVANASVHDGDTLVVLPAPGPYGSFTLTKSLRVVGDPTGARPRVSGKSYVTAPGGATLAGIDFNGLEFKNVPAPIVVDDIRVDGAFGGLASCNSFLVDGCATVQLWRCVIEGKDGDALCESSGVEIVNSHVVLTDCAVNGGKGWSDFLIGYHGQPALDIGGTSEVLVTFSPLTGGDGAPPQCMALCNSMGGDGAPAIRVGGAATCEVRGNLNIIERGGQGGAGGLVSGSPAPFAVDGTGAFITSGGVQYIPNAFAPGLSSTILGSGVPFIHVRGKDGPGETKRLSVFGPPGAAVLVVLGIGADHVLLPGLLDGPLYLPPAGILAVLPYGTISQTLSVNTLLQLPAAQSGLAGLTATFQAVEPIPGGYRALNPSGITLRF